MLHTSKYHHHAFEITGRLHGRLHSLVRSHYVEPQSEEMHDGMTVLTHVLSAVAITVN